MIRSLIEKYQESKMQCPYDVDCDAMVLGGLLKALKSQGLLPLPTPPFTKLSFQALAEKLRDMSVPTLCDKLGRKGFRQTFDNRRGYKIASCDIKEKILEKLTEVEEKLRGFDLEGELQAENPEANGAA
jgi:hypothetical protein